MQQESQNFLIVCGGTGGHLAPGIGLAERLILRGHQCRLVVSRKEVDARLRQKYTQLNFEPAPGVAVSWNPLGIVKFLIQFVQALFHANMLLKKFKPSAIVVFGGFMSPPYILCGRLKHIYIATHESNRTPGRAIRFMSRWADRVYLPIGVKIAGVPASRIRACGYPLRAEIKHIKKDVARTRMGLTGHGKTLVVVGGSQGAMALNNWVSRHFKSLAADGINVFAVTGLGKGVESVIELKSDQGESVKATFLPFSDDMGLLLSVADLVVSRAGAGAIAELTECLAPAILVPYPYAADQHQEANARFLEKQGACVVVAESSMDELYREVNDLLFNDWMLTRMRNNLRALNRGVVAEEMCHDLEVETAAHWGKPMLTRDASV